ncbi:MAG: family 20 glycosylhydrolase [Planctomycetes bacterium]|nr:family 20 glycosylhydrolase [Planctomycetota bacterium]
MDLSFLNPPPHALEETGAAFERPAAVRIAASKADSHSAKLLAADLKALAGIKVLPRAAFTIKLVRDEKVAHPEGYLLKLGEGGAEIRAATEAGVFYGVQTLLQVAVFGDAKRWPALSIDDRPHFGWRSFMLDMGRSIYRFAYLKRIVRILARLKMNALHLHLNDDEMSGLRFRKLPIGKENPHALALAELKQLIAYARKHHVTVLPEIECWGHAGFGVYHFPHLRGGRGMYGGSSFAIGPETFDLFAKIFDELLPVLEKECHVHVGLDEAHWALLPSVPEAERAKYSPEFLIQRLYELLQAAAKKHRRSVTMHLWADHKGRPVPKHLEGKLVLHPWRYLRRNEEDIKGKLERLGGAGKPALICGSGTGQAQMGAHYLSTMVWTNAAKDVPNVRGATLCQWCMNNVADQMIGIYAGAGWLWTPGRPLPKENDLYGEFFTSHRYAPMRVWQARFRDGDPEALRKDCGPEVHNGFYLWGPKAGKPAAPTASWNQQWNNESGIDG